MIEEIDSCTNAHVVKNGYLVDIMELERGGSSTQTALIAPRIALQSGNTGTIMSKNGIRTPKLVSEQEKRMKIVGSRYGQTFRIFLVGS